MLAKKHLRVWSVVVVVLLIVAGVVGWKLYGRNNEQPSDNQTAVQTTNVAEDKLVQTSEPEKVATGTVITTGNSEFGTMLFNDKNQAIYIWELEDSMSAKCYGDCAEAWPPVLTDGAPQGSGEVDDSLLGTITRTDGTTQVTYNGHPLYYYAHEAPGEVKCHNISTHGGLWWVVQPNGNRAP